MPFLFILLVEDRYLIVICLFLSILVCYLTEGLQFLTITEVTAITEARNNIFLFVHTFVNLLVKPLLLLQYPQALQ